jgi:hypothetical protein
MKILHLSQTLYIPEQLFLTVRRAQFVTRFSEILLAPILCISQLPFLVLVAALHLERRSEKMKLT